MNKAIRVHDPLDLLPLTRIVVLDLRPLPDRPSQFIGISNEAAIARVADELQPVVDAARPMLERDFRVASSSRALVLKVDQPLSSTSVLVPALFGEGQLQPPGTTGGSDELRALFNEQFPEMFPAFDVGQGRPGYRELTESPPTSSSRLLGIEAVRAALAKAKTHFSTTRAAALGRQSEATSKAWF